jgi:peptidoglycan endopeptidase LytE
MGRWRCVGVILIVLFVSFGFCRKGLAEERYRVKPGDTLSGISKTFGVSIDVLKKANRLEKDTIKPKQILVIPTHSSILQPGQTLLLQRLVSETEEEMEEVGDREEVPGFPSAEKEKEKEAVRETLAKWTSSEERNLFVKVVKNFLGVPYRLGGSTLKGIDCSAFVKKIYEIFNTTLPRTAREQFRIGKSVAKEELQEGDLVFFNTRRSNISHVGIYIGNREFVHASSQNRQVKVDSLDMPYFSKHFLRGGRIKELESDS